MVAAHVVLRSPSLPDSALVICATPRSGSTLLCDLLTSTKVAGRPQSYFRLPDIDRWASTWNVDRSEDRYGREFNRAYLAAMIEAGADGTGVFGLRMMWPSVAEATRRFNVAFGEEAGLVVWLDRLFGSTLFVHLSRCDTVAQAVSLVRAEQTGLWHVAADGSERQRTAVPQVPVFDPARIYRAKDMIEAEDAEWSSFFDQYGVQPLRLTYETLAMDPKASLANILAALGRDPSAATMANVQTARMADKTNDDWVEQMKAY